MKKLIRTLTLTIGVCLALLCSAQAIELKTGIGIVETVSYTHLRAHETGRNLVCRLLLEKKN